MLEHQKTVLNGVCHNKALFEKELLKSLDWMDALEQEQLKHWVYNNYYQQYPDIINHAFNSLYEQAS